MNYLSRLSLSLLSFIFATTPAWAGTFFDSANTGLETAKEEALLVGGLIVGLVAALVVVSVIIRMIRGV